jgi:hypothetical protein
MINFNYSNGLIIGAIDGEPFQIKIQDIEKITKLVKLANKYNEVDSNKNKLKKKINKIINPAEGFIQEYPDWIIKNGNLYLKSDETQTAVPGLLCDKIKNFLDKGEDVTSFKTFWESCLNNPRFEAIEELVEFLDHNYLAITEDGGFIAKKNVILQSGEPVPSEFEGWYMSSNGDVYNSFGKVSDYFKKKFLKYLESVRFVSWYDKRTSWKVGEWTRIPREECTFDPNTSCGPGLHSGSDEYVYKQFTWFKSITIYVYGRPEYVTSVPKSESAHKLRCHALKTIGIASSDSLEDGNFKY